MMGSTVRIRETAPTTEGRARKGSPLFNVCARYLHLERSGRNLRSDEPGGGIGMMRIVGTVAMTLAAFAALAQDSKPAEPPTSAEPASANALASPTAAAEEKKEKAFKPPPGFQTKKRGELVLYCKKDATLGTRFKTEKCYDEPQMREYMLALEQQKLDVDRIRGTCGGGDACAPPDPTVTR